MSEKLANSDKTTRWVTEASNMIRAMVVEVAKIGWCRPVPSPEKKKLKNCLSITPVESQLPSLSESRLEVLPHFGGHRTSAVQKGQRTRSCTVFGKRISTKNQRTASRKMYQM